MNSHELWDLIEHHPEVHFSPEEIVDLAMPLLPRFYSIASSQKVHPNEIHLTIAYLRYETRGITRMGVCTHYLCQLADLHHPVVPVYIQPSHDFKLTPDQDRAIIMIGPGTGVAPFRSFMQDREARGDTGKSWLFFGEWTSAHEFFYEDEWKRWEASGLLKLDTAFSRDQEHKIYVQHRLKEKGSEIYQWLERGAILYICGDAHQMAKDVEQTLKDIIQEHGNTDAAGAQSYIKRLRAEKRYLRDVY
jgi:sulfite reductase (NADPH) flavoprotein alpha-component